MWIFIPANEKTVIGEGLLYMENTNTFLNEVLFTTASRTALRPTQPPSNGY
jgi:hypothetical protein